MFKYCYICNKKIDVDNKDEYKIIDGNCYCNDCIKNKNRTVKSSYALCADCGKPIDKTNIFQCVEINGKFYCKDCATKIQATKTADNVQLAPILSFLKVLIVILSVIGFISGIVFGKNSIYFSYTVMISVWLSFALLVLFLFLFYVVIKNQLKIIEQNNTKIKK